MHCRRAMVDGKTNVGGVRRQGVEVDASRRGQMMLVMAIVVVMVALLVYRMQWRLQNYFLRGPIRNINYVKFKTKENLNVLTSQKTKPKKKKKTEIHKVLQLFSMMFHILKLLNDFFIINLTSYIFFNVYSQVIIHPLISH